MFCHTTICSRQAAVVLSLDPTAGHEQQGTRPVLIVTPAAFN
ncbi:type II toxin-antitoxin system PemK/MazF family toxin, partial [Escherichia coli]|nr:type II toxin-antitoxin system PemK/MazF family toxin [Escherichia coli]MCK2874725.1 type II toxin-antitoxin system PemK/MazF family toxin [Escherichia coli]MCK2894305.1 type II toxin-antitoxin system PemK/MazF family toxin [Escherichia coli]MCK2913857.1 type II toxin-antitoxin system PemK/MazF family toxin [Escherichia coli]MCK2947118.1 type II toxin-antitoxin system PemK/MazF family toxin [Escherichia coli]